MVANQTTQIGPNHRPTPPAPRFWTANRTISSPSAITGTNGSIRPLRLCTTSSPSTAESTETAGVRIASPKNMPAPTMPMIRIAPLARPPAFWTRAMSESVPPSPRLSKRMRIMTYFSVTMTIRVHSISETTPITSDCARRPPAWLMCLMDSLNA